MATLDIVTGNVSPGLLKQAAAWADVAAATPSVESQYAQRRIRRIYDGSTQYYLSRMYLTFDVTPFQTGGAHAGATINSVVLHLSCQAHDTHGAISIYYKDWGTGNVAAGDWAADLGALTLAVDSYVWPAATGYQNLTLSNTGSLLTVNGRFEMASDDETTQPTGNDQSIYFYQYAKGDGYWPYITVDYTDVAAGCPRQVMSYYQQ